MKKIFLYTQLTTLIVKKDELPPPELSYTALYSGALPDIPTSIAAINRLTILSVESHT